MLQTQKLYLNQLNLINNGHPQAPTELRKKIQHYSFSMTQKIGKGFSSVVYKGRNDITNQTVAIKVIELKSLRDDITRNLLDTELQCMKKINHVNLLKCFDSYRTVNNCYIVTQFCEGGDMQKYLRQRGRFTESQFVKFFAQFYSGYKSFLNAGYIHRDLKPANIFIKGDQIKIADFGMVKKLTQNPRDNYNVGTPVYMPPQSLLSNIYTQKSDVWAIGVMCYQLTHGTLPWKGYSEQELKINIQNTKVCFDYNLISGDLIKFISQCLDKNPNSRMSIAEMFGQNWMLKNIAPLLDKAPINTHENHKMNINLNSININSLNQSITNGYHQTNIKNTHGSSQVLNQRSANILNNPNRNSTQKSSSLNHNHNFNNTSHQNINYNLIALQAVPSIQILDLKQNNENVRPLKSQRLTMDSDSLPENIKRKISFMEENNKAVQKQTKKSALDYLIAILNYLRYIYKVYKIVSQSKSIYLSDEVRNTIKKSLAKELIRCLINQQKMIKNKQNVYGLANWSQFITSKKWDTYTHVVEQYSKKYRKQYEQYSSDKQNNDQYNTNTIKRISLPLKTSIENLHKSINSCNKSKQNEQNTQIFHVLQILDYLVTIYNLEEVIFCFGWLKFVEKSPIDDIVQFKCLVNKQNYELTRKKIEKEINRISKNS